MASVTLTGTLDEPLQNNVRAIELRVQERSPDEDAVSTTMGMRNGTESYHPWIGFLDTRPPEVSATVFLPRDMFERGGDGQRRQREARRSDCDETALRPRVHY
jgi:hypothetical protein